MSPPNLNILVADDIPEIISAVETFLRRISAESRNNLQIFSAASGIEVMDIMSESRIDAFFLDHHFENGITGDQIIEQIYDPFAQQMIILMSGWEENEIERVMNKQRRRLGQRFQFLQKPFVYLMVKDKYQEIEQFFLNRPYPNPLAYVFDALTASLTAQSQVIAIKDLLETLLKYIVTILMADMDRLKLAQGFEPRINIAQNLTFGAWMTWLFALVKHLEPYQQNLFMPEIIDLFGSRHPSNYKLISEFKDFRDAELGHGYQKEEEWFAGQAQKFLLPVQKLYRECLFTTQYILMVQEKADFSEMEPDQFEYKVRLLMGADTRFTLADFRSPLKIVRGDVVLYSPKNEILPLSPFLTYHNCPQCSLNRVYILDRIQEARFVYNAFCNHRYPSEKGVPAFWQKYPNMTAKK
jgi:CheY-like chemotaxis protein